MCHIILQYFHASQSNKPATNFCREIYGHYLRTSNVTLNVNSGRFNKNSVLKKVKEFYNKKRPSKGWPEVHLLHDNASSHKCEFVKSFLASEKVKVLNHPPYSPDLSPCDFFLFPRLKKMLSGNK